jgi:hypothetical protein
MSKPSSLPRRPPASRPGPVSRKSVPTKPVRRKPARKKPAATPPAQALHRELITKRRGELAELAFALKACNLGFGVSKPYGDSERYDVILDSRDLEPKPPGAPFLARSLREKWGFSPTTFSAPSARRVRTVSLHYPRVCSPPLWRVQIKCTTQLVDGLYRLNAHRRTQGRAVPYLLGEIDFLAACVIPEDTWYIVPLAAFHGRTSLLFRPRKDRRPGMYDNYREAWHLLRKPNNLEFA